MNGEMKFRGLLTVKDAARQLQREVFTVYRMLWSGRLKGNKRKSRWFIWSTDLRRAANQWKGPDGSSERR